jgi:glycosyltransferase involved in cell wall biosynthesis
VCDFQYGLLSRILDVYRFFEKPPRIVLARGGRKFPTDPRLTVHFESIPVSVNGLEDVGLAGALSVICSAIGYLLFSLILCLRIRRSRHVIGLVHAHYVLPQGLFGLVIARFLRVPLIVTVSGTDVNIMMKRIAITRALCLFVLNHAHATIAVSKPLRRWLYQFGVAHCTYVPNSVDTSSTRSLGESMHADRILFVGRLTTNKRPLILIRAFDEIAREIPTATLLMCGDGPLKQTVEGEIVKRGLEGKVKMFGWVSPRFVNELRSKAGLFVLPSASEGLSVALLEAMAAGQTIIVSQNESHAAVIEDGKNGLLFQLDDSGHLANQIRLAIADKSLRVRLSRSALRLCQTEFSNAVVAKALENVYSGAVRLAVHRRTR